MDAFMRIKEDWLQLAFLTLQKEAHEIALLATIDLGPKEYFDRVAEHIRKREKRGFAILFEDVDGIDETLGKELDAEYAEYLTTKRDALNALQKHGIWHLTDVVKREDYWVNADNLEPVLADMRAEAARTPDGWEKLIAERRNRYASMLQNPEEVVASLRKYPLPPQVYDLDDLFAKSHVHDRDGHAVETICEHVEKHHVFSFWGPDHMHGILRGLKEKDFEVAQTQWMDVMVVDVE